MVFVFNILAWCKIVYSTEHEVACYSTISFVCRIFAYDALMSCMCNIHVSNETTMVQSYTYEDRASGTDANAQVANRQYEANPHRIL